LHFERLTMIARILVALLFSTVFCHIAHATSAETSDSKKNERWVDPGWRRTVARYYVKFDEQGLSTTTFEFEFQPLNDRGAAAVAQETFSYNSYFSDLTASDLVTVKADGRIIPVDQRAVRDQPSSADASSPYFDERRIKIIAYPDVSPGDRIRGRLIYTDKRPEFPGEFASYWSQYPGQPPETMELTLDGPASKSLQIAARGVDHTEERVGDRILHHVTFKQDTPRPPTDPLDGFDDARRFEASTFRDYAVLAATLNVRNAPMAAPDDAIKKLSTEIVGDGATTRAKVERIHNWVAQHIRYVGIGFEDGGLTAQPASATLATRYGDCKAHAVLLKALLSAQGIDANLVAVNATPRFTLTQLATQNFDHAIVYVPELDLYLDPTSALAAFGALPPDLYGKPVLNIDKGIVSTIPVLKPEQFVIETNTDYVLRSNGTRQAKSTFFGAGVGASLVRRLAREAETVDQGELATHTLKASNLVGSGAYDFTNPRELANVFAIRASFEITQPVTLSAPSRLRLRALVNQDSSLWDMISGEEREAAFPCRSLDYEDIASLALPEGSHVYEKPGALAFSLSFKGDTAYGPVNGRVEMSGTVALDGQTARSESHVRFTFSAPVCPASFSAEIKDALSKFDEFGRGVIGLTPEPVSQVVERGSDYAEGLEAYRSRNYTFALMKFLPAAEQGNADARNYLGSMYETGKGVPQDYHLAFSWYAKAAALGDKLGQSHLGYLYTNGLGAPLDYKQAFDWYLKAAEQGDAYSQCSLGVMYAKGQGVAQDYGRAMEWYVKAAEQGNAEAQADIGLLYAEAKGVSRDYKQAAHWYQQAADRGYGYAQLQLGVLYAYGRGVPLDYSIAIEWFRKAAAQGYNVAQYNLGYAYEKGLGVAQDNQLAMEWYRLAAGKGNAEARSRLDALSGASWGGAGFWSGLFHLLSLPSR
jgi:TPR repeat protein/transglutaminase-like putative cysteine protease